MPQQYKLMGYARHSVQDAASSYVPFELARPLRTGALVYAFDQSLAIVLSFVSVHVA